MLTAATKRMVRYSGLCIAFALGILFSAYVNGQWVSGDGASTELKIETGISDGQAHVAIKSAAGPSTSSELGRVEWYSGSDDGSSIAVFKDGSTSAFDMRFSVQPDMGIATEAMRIKSTGRVGIGTTAPLHRFHSEINSNTSGQYAGLFKNANTGATADGLMVSTGSTGSAANALRVVVGGGSIDAFYVKGNGNVGVGTANPASALQVVGYTQLALTAGAPPSADCDAALERGRMKVDNAAGLLYICMNSGWVSK